MKKFPKDFLFGASISGPQSEGTKGKHELSNFDYWSKNKKSDFYNQVDSSITSNMYETFLDDIKLFQKVGIKLYRTSIQWTRLIENFETNKVNEDAVRYYREYFKAVKDAGITLVVNLYHFDTPMFWEEKGGWETNEFVEAFANYGKLCFQLFGDLVDLWATMNEPVGIPDNCYSEGIWYPWVKDFKRAVQVGYNEILANARVVQEFKKMFSGQPEKQICVILNNAMLAIPKDDQPENVEAAKAFDSIHNRSYLDAMVKGVFPSDLKDYLVQINAVPKYTKDELEIIKNNPVDFLGVNYYAPFRVQAPLEKNKEQNDLSRFCEHYLPENVRMNKSRGWEILPETVYDISMVIKNNYGNIRWWLAENGMGVMNEEQFMNENGEVQDDYRIDYIKEHLEKLHLAIENGANCFAYCLWAPLDCWSWHNAYKNRYGLIGIDLKNQKRTIKKSGFWFKELSESKEIK